MDDGIYLLNLKQNHIKWKQNDNMTYTSETTCNKMQNISVAKMVTNFKKAFCVIDVGKR